MENTQIHLWIYLALIFFLGCNKEDEKVCGLVGQWYEVISYDGVSIADPLATPNNTFYDVKNANEVQTSNAIGHDFESNVYTLSDDCTTIEKMQVVENDLLEIKDQDNDLILLFSNLNNEHNIYKRN